MPWKQLTPVRYAEDGIGWCLRQTQSSLYSPVRFNSAREAWDGQQGRHTDYPPMGIAVPIWFDHWGTYGSPPVYKNWGHVATRLPNGQVLSSPFWPKTYGYDVFPNIQAMMNSLGGNARYLGWSEYMNGRPIVEFNTPAPPPSPQPEPQDLDLGEEMFIADVKGSFYLIVPQGNSKPQAVVLGSDSRAVGSGIPVIAFNWDPSIAALKSAVSGVK